jgi:hypothetical protein
MSRKEASLSLIATIVILAVSIVVALTDFGIFGIAQGQANDTSLTPEQKDAICNPNNPASKLNPVNTTESRICGIPKTLNSTSSTTPDNTTTGAETPSEVPTPSPSSPSSPSPPTSIAPEAAPPSE